MAFQGLRGAFSHTAGGIFAASRSFEPEFAPCPTFADVFAQVMAGESGWGVLPLENSTIGSIVASYDLLWEHDVIICAEVVTPVHHQLLSIASAELEKIKEVYSHPAALEQCRQFFARHPRLVPTAYFDTSGAARYVAECRDPAKAAIASEMAASEYGLTIVKENIEDSPLNSTRFGIISASKRADTVPPFPYKLSCAFALPHRPGSLAGVVQGIARCGANLTKIESRPVPEQPWHYRFFIDMEISSPDMEAEALAAVAESHSLKILGRYRKAG